MLVVLLGLGTKATRLGEEEDHVSDENTCFSCHKHDLRCPDFSSRCSANWPHGPLEMSLLKNVEKAASSCHHLHATLLACTLTPSHPRNENTITAKEIK